jgi:hypothetical protein
MAPGPRRVRVLGATEHPVQIEPLSQAAPLRPLPGSVAGLDQFRVQRGDRADGVIHEYRLLA